MTSLLLCPLTTFSEKCNIRLNVFATSPLPNRAKGGIRSTISGNYLLLAFKAKLQGHHQAAYSLVKFHTFIFDINS